MNNPLIPKIRRAANIGLYGSLATVIVTVVFHFLPWRFFQSEYALRWMLIAGSVLAVLAVVMVLLMIRKTTPRIRQMETLEQKMKAYSEYISNLYYGTLSIVVMECVLIVLMADTSLLMVTIILVLLLFLAYPNMYKMKSDLGLLQEEFNTLFPDYAEPVEPTEDATEPEQ
jgi:MFS family permease